MLVGASATAQPSPSPLVTQSPVGPFRNLGELRWFASAVFADLTRTAASNSAGGESAPVLVDSVEVARMALYTLFGVHVSREDLQGTVRRMECSSSPAAEAFDAKGSSQEETDVVEVTPDVFERLVTQQAEPYTVGGATSWMLWDSLDPNNRGYATPDGVREVAFAATAAWGVDSAALLADATIDAAADAVRELDDDGDGKVMGCDVRRVLVA